MTHDVLPGECLGRRRRPYPDEFPALGSSRRVSMRARLYFQMRRLLRQLVEFVLFDPRLSLERQKRFPFSFVRPG